MNGGGILKIPKWCDKLFIRVDTLLKFTVFVEIRFIYDYFEFLVSVLYILLVVISTIVPTYLFGCSNFPNFIKNVIGFFCILISLSAHQTFGNYFIWNHSLLLLCFFIIAQRKGKLFSFSVSFLFFQVFVTYFLTIWIRVLSGEPCFFVDSFSIYDRSVFDLLSIFLCCKIMKRWSLD